MRPVGGADEAGASAVEYGLIVFAIAAVIALIVFALGLVNRDSFHSSCEQITTQIANTNCDS